MKHDKRGHIVRSLGIQTNNMGQMSVARQLKVVLYICFGRQLVCLLSQGLTSWRASERGVGDGGDMLLFECLTITCGCRQALLSAHQAG